VKTWNETLKFVNMDLIQDIAKYDPTAIQKKLNIRRAKKIVKGRQFDIH